jgi:hypothetical protein
MKNKEVDKVLCCVIVGGGGWSVTCVGGKWWSLHCWKFAIWIHVCCLRFSIGKRFKAWGLKLEIIKCEYHMELSCTETFACFSFCWYGEFLKKDKFIGCRNPTLAKCEDETHTPKVGELESSEIPESLEFNSKGQNTLPWGVISVIGKVLKCRCPKWPRIGHLDICSPSYGQKKGRESNC